MATPNFKDLTKEYKGIYYILLEDAEAVVKEFGKNRYEISENKKGLYKITKDKNGRCGDFLLSIPTEEDLKEISWIYILKIMNYLTP